MSVFDSDRKKMEDNLRKIAKAMEDVSVMVEAAHYIKDVEYTDVHVTDDGVRPGIFAGNKTGLKMLTLRVTYVDAPELSEAKKERLKAIEEELRAELNRIKQELGDV